MLLIKNLPKYECLLEGAKRYPDLDPSACEAYLHLLSASSDISSAFDRFLEHNNLSQGRFTVMMLLDRFAETPTNPADLADRSGVSRATMTGLIDVLVRDGMVQREPDPQDRRMTRVRLTPEGQQFLNGILPDYFRKISSVMSRLDDGERRTLVHLMDKIRQGVGSKDQPAAT